MGSGIVKAIFITDRASSPMVGLEEVRAEAGKGLAGDRNHLDNQPAMTGPDREATLIESEAIIAARRDYEIELEPSETRRNIVTEGVALNHLVGKSFRVGEVTLEGIRLCEPCKLLESLTRPNVRKSLVHRGGLRARIVEGGVIRVGDAVIVVS